MTLSAAEIEAVLRDLSPALVGGRVQRVDQPDRHKLILTVRKGAARCWLLFCAHPRFSRLHLLTTRPEQGKPAAGFCNVVRQHMRLPQLTDIRVAGAGGEERIVALELIVRDRLMQPRRLSLVAELVGAGSNLILLDESRKVLAVLFREASVRRRLSPGVQYQPPKRPTCAPERARSNRFASYQAGEDPLSLSRAIEAHYSALEAEAEAQSLRSELLRALRRRLRPAHTLLTKIGAGLQTAEAADTLRRKGELLKIALPDLKPGQQEVLVEDVFDPSRPCVAVELHPLLSPQENIERLFRLYRKAKASRDRLAARMGETKEEIRRLETLRAEAEAASSLSQLRGLVDRLRQGGILLPQAKQKTRGRAAEPKGPRVFRSVEGLEILVSRNQRENGRLTFSIARGNDWWMHLLGWPGPHVVIKAAPGKSVSQETLLDAAHLAVYFSKVRSADAAEVAYTQCKNVRRMKGAPAGRVSYSHATTMRVRIGRERLDRLLKAPTTETD